LRIVGIDPGLEGAIAALDHYEHSTPVVHAIFSMPVDFDGTEINGRGLYTLLGSLNPDLVVVEKLQGNPAFGANNFKFGGSYYAAIYVCQILGLSMERITPQRWKKTILEGTAKDKKAAIKWARGAYPTANLVPEGQKTASHDFAEALCLAEFGLRLKVGATT
jgi:crossover junction endodeoxyribonuclease RuvC